MSTADDFTGAPGDGGNVVHLPAPRLPEIDITNERDAVRAIVASVNDDIQGLYVKAGQPVEIAEVDDGNGPKLVISTVGPDRLRRILADRAFCYRWVKGKRDDEPRQVPALPGVSTAKAVLSSHDWPGLRHLAGVVRMPIVRADGSVFTTRGYDPVTRLYYWPAFPVREAPERPTRFQAKHARSFLMDYLLRDVCWDSEASRANYVALLFTPLLRHIIGGLYPLGLISAATPGSGKTLLTDILGSIYGVYKETWVRKSEEFDKRVSSILRDRTEPVVCFDNVETTDTIRHPELAMLLTSEEYGGRVLGQTATTTGINDRLWLATGNNIAVGGDIPSRSILVRLDPQMERPEEREGFAIQEDIWTWLRNDTNRANLMYYMLVLVRAWIADGAPRDNEQRMRNFTNWAQVTGGLVNWLGLPGFLANTSELKIGSNSDEAAFTAFLTKWHEKYGTTWKSAKELVESARVSYVGDRVDDPWDGDFLSNEINGRTIPLSSKSLGRYLAARKDRIFDGYRLRRSETQTAKTWYWRVEPVEEG